MKDNMESKAVVVSAIFFCLFLLVVSPVSALTITDSSNFDLFLNDGARITDSDADSKLYSKELFKSTANDIPFSGTAFLSEIPYFEKDGILYFKFIYDIQETGGDRQIQIDDIVVSVSGDTYWVLNGTILLNSQAPYSNSSGGNGGDMELYVPVSLFTGLTGSDLLTLTVTQSLSDNGDEEWALGPGTGGSYFAPTSLVVPLPPSALLLGSGLLGLGLLGWRRKRS